MGYVSCFYVEAFELFSQSFRLIEKRRGLASAVVLGKWSVIWLKNMVELSVGKPDITEFINSCREEHKAFIAHRVANRAGHFLELVEYAVGGRRGLIVIPEGSEGQGWRLFSIEMRKVVDFFGSSSGVVWRHDFSGFSFANAGGSSSRNMDKKLVLGGGSEIFVEVVSEMETVIVKLPLSFGPLGNARSDLEKTVAADFSVLKNSAQGAAPVFHFGDSEAHKEKRRGGIPFMEHFVFGEASWKKIREKVD
jgi:hypothetical protein